MKLLPVPSTKTFKAPGWLKRHPVSGVFYVEEFRADSFPKRICRSTGIDSNKELAKLKGEEIRNKWLGTKAPVRLVTIAELCAEVLANQEAKFKRGKIKIGTLENSRIYLKYIGDEFGHYAPGDITEALWNAFCARFHRDSPGRSLINHWSFMGMVMTYAFKNGYSTRAWEVENPDPKKRAGRVLTDDELASIYQTASPDLKDQLLFAVTMGMRLREHLGLAWAQVDLGAGTVTVLAEKNKNGKERIIRMSPQVREMLERRARESATKPGAFVFPSASDPRKPAHENRTAWTAAKRRAGIRGRCRYHDLRHTFVSQCAKLVRSGKVSVVLICAFIDMSIRVFEKVYLHLNADDTAPVAELIAVKVR